MKALCFKVEPALPSLNDVVSKFSHKFHRQARSRFEKEWIEIVGMNLRAHLHFNKISFDPEGKNPLFSGPVKITIINYSPKPLDPDNVYGKVAIDALKGIIIPNDTAKVVGGGVHYYSYPIKPKAKSFAAVSVERIESTESLQFPFKQDGGMGEGIEDD